MGLADRDPVFPSFMGFKSSVMVSHSIQLKMPNVPGFFSSHDNTISVRMCENFDFPTVAENMYRSMTDINQPLAARDMTGREAYVD